MKDNRSFLWRVAALEDDENCSCGYAGVEVSHPSDKDRDVARVGHPGLWCTPGACLELVVGVGRVGYWPWPGLIPGKAHSVALPALPMQSPPKSTAEPKPFAA